MALGGGKLMTSREQRNRRRPAMIYHRPDEIIFGRIIFLRVGVRIMSHAARVTNKGFGGASRLLHG